MFVAVKTVVGIAARDLHRTSAFKCDEEEILTLTERDRQRVVR